MFKKNLLTANKEKPIFTETLEDLTSFEKDHWDITTVGSSTNLTRTYLIIFCLFYHPIEIFAVYTVCPVRKFSNKKLITILTRARNKKSKENFDVIIIMMLLLIIKP